MRCVTAIIIAATLVLPLRGQERKPPLTPQGVESLVRDLPDDRLAVEVRERGVSPLLPWRDVQRLRALGIGPATLSALDRFFQPLSLTVVVEPPLPDIPVSLTSKGGTVVPSIRSTTTGPHGTAVIDGLRPGSYRMTLTPPRTQRFVERDIEIGYDNSREQINLAAAAGRLTVLVQDARLSVSSLGSYDGPVRNLEVPAGTYELSVAKSGYLPYSTSITVAPGEDKSIAPTLKRQPVQYPVVHRHNWGRCWGTLIVSDDSLTYQQSGGPGTDSLDVPTNQVSKVSQWSTNQFEILLKDGRKLHLAHGALKPADKTKSGVTLEDIVDVRPIGPVIEAIQRALDAVR